LCKLESKQLFGIAEENKLLFSAIKVDPSISPFIKSRTKILSSSNDFSELITLIQKQNIEQQGFVIEYVILDGDSTEKNERREKLKDIGYCIQGRPDFRSPSITYALCFYKGNWYFGLMIKENIEWHKHKQKPQSFSNSIGMTIAKTLVTIASKGNTHIKLLDVCCGVGTIMLEASISGFDIEGCDINENACTYTRRNLSHYGYSANVHHTDIKHLNKQYDAVIIDLPYNFYSHSSEIIVLNIIEAAAKLADRIIIVSTSDIESFIATSGLIVSDFCTIVKRGKSQFTRKIWVCDKDDQTKKSQIEP
jgi:tRNA G10  N-methylase Trm11